MLTMKNCGEHRGVRCAVVGLRARRPGLQGTPRRHRGIRTPGGSTHLGESHLEQTLLRFGNLPVDKRLHFQAGQVAGADHDSPAAALTLELDQSRAVASGGREGVLSRGKR